MATKTWAGSSSIAPIGWAIPDNWSPFSAASGDEGDGAPGTDIYVSDTQTLTAAQAIAAYNADPNMAPVQVVDSTQNVSNDVDDLQVLTANGKLTGIGLTDTDRVMVSPTQLSADSATLGLIAGPYRLQVSFSSPDELLDRLDYTLANNVNDLYVTGGDGAQIVGNSQFDTIILAPAYAFSSTTVYGGSGGSYIVASGRYTDLFGGSGPNTIYANAGVQNYVQGGAGSPSDVLVASSLHNIVYGGSGNNYIVGNGSDNYLVGGGGINSIYANGTNDYLYGGSGPSNVLSETGSGSNHLWGGSGNNYIVAGGGDELLVGGPVTDYLIARSGNDTLYGGEGTDYIYPGAGQDFIWTDNVGAPQSQDFIYETPSTGVNTIADFTPGDGPNRDVLVISGASLMTFADVQAHATQNGPYTVIPVGGSDQIYLYNVQPFQLTANDFIFLPT